MCHSEKVAYSIMGKIYNTFSIFPCFCIGNPGRVPRSWSPFLWPLGAQTLIYWAALEMGEGGGEQVTAPELGNEAQNEGLAASGRCPWLIAWLPCSSSGHVNKSRITQGDSSDPCETPLVANVSASRTPLLPFGTISDISEEPLSSPNIQMFKERLFFFRGFFVERETSNCQILFRDMPLMM